MGVGNRAVVLALALAAAWPAAGGEPLRLGVVSFYNPRLMYLKYQPLVDFLTERTGTPWVLAISTSYEEAVRDICSGRTAVAYLGPLTYLRAHERCEALPVVRLQTRGSATYTSLILVRQDSPLRSLAELAGTRFGFGAPLSTSSHLVPRSMLVEAGLRPGENIACRYFGHHERVAKAVLAGEVDAGGVRDLTGEKFLDRGLRVLAASAPIPNFPLVVGPKTTAEVRDAVLRVLVQLPAEDPHVRALVAGWDEELAGGFAASLASEFEALRGLAARVFGPQWALLPERQLECGGGGPSR